MQKTGNLSLNISPQYSACGDRNSGNIKNISSLSAKTKNASVVSEELFDADAMSRLMDSSVNDVVHVYSENSKINYGSTNMVLGLETQPAIRSANVIGHNNNNDGYYINNNDMNRINSGNINDVNCQDIDIMARNDSEVTTVLESDPSGRHVGIKFPKPTKLSRIGNKSVGLKRVSFGSSKGSMVETLVFETPTPLSEHVEHIFEILPNNMSMPIPSMDDSGIDLQEELQRSIVRVSIYQSNQPRQVCPPEFVNTYTGNLELLESFSTDNCYLRDNMTTPATMSIERQQSTDSGWDNPFRPGGDLSREADEIVNMIKGGKPITPTEEIHLGNGNTQKGEYSNEKVVTAEDGVIKKNVAQSQSVQNGTTSVQAPSTERQLDSNGTTTHAQVSNKVVPGPTSASHVLIGEKKNKKKGCCVIQ